MSENVKAHKTSSDADTKQLTIESYMNPIAQSSSSSSSIATKSAHSYHAEATAPGMSPVKVPSSPQKRSQFQSDIPSYYLKLLSNNTMSDENAVSAVSSATFTSIHTTIPVDQAHAVSKPISTLTTYEPHNNVYISQEEQSKPNTFPHTTIDGRSNMQRESTSIISHSTSTYPPPYEMRPTATNNSFPVQSLPSASTSSSVNTKPIADDSGLTQSQREKIEKNRLAALQLRQKKMQEEEARLKGPERTHQFIGLNNSSGNSHRYEHQPIHPVSTTSTADIMTVVANTGGSGIARQSVPYVMPSMHSSNRTFQTNGTQGNQPPIPSTVSDYGYPDSSIIHSNMVSGSTPINHTFRTSSGKNIVVAVPESQTSHNDVPSSNHSGRSQLNYGASSMPAPSLPTISHPSGLPFPAAYSTTRNVFDAR